MHSLDLAIPDMNRGPAELQVAEMLRVLPGIAHVRLLERGAFIRYQPEVIDHHQICAAIRRLGFRASTFQDSATGETGKSFQ